MPVTVIVLETTVGRLVNMASISVLLKSRDAMVNVTGIMQLSIFERFVHVANVDVVSVTKLREPEGKDTLCSEVQLRNALARVVTAAREPEGKDTLGSEKQLANVPDKLVTFAREPEGKDTLCSEKQLRNALVRVVTAPMAVIFTRCTKLQDSVPGTANTVQDGALT